MDQKCSKGFKEPNEEWRLQDIKPIYRRQGDHQSSIVSYEEKHPVLLPNEHRISLLITSHMHNHGHPGVATTTEKIRRKYWILKANKLSKAVKFKCVSCREMAHKAETQLMADLPALRLAPQTPPFYYSSCDYFGPYNVKRQQDKKALWRYLHMLKHKSRPSRTSC